MRTDRRTMIKGSALLGAAVAVPLAASSANAAPRLIVFDSRIPESDDFAARSGTGHRLDIADGDQTGWVDLRGGLPQVGAVEGLTGWSDWTAVRGELEARGLRLASEGQVAAPLSGMAHLFRWSMRAR